MRRIKLVIAYDGAGFRGLAPNHGVRTVVGELEQVLAPLFGRVPEIAMSGRTDAGVHATMQVLSLDAPASEPPCRRIQRAINSRLGPEIVALEVSEATLDFHARHSATGRSYRYTVFNRGVPDPFSARTAWWVGEPLNLHVMRLACDPIIGTHDFASFCRKSKAVPGVEHEPSTIRRVDSARWIDAGAGFFHFDISGSAFCHQMVRSIVGFHVAVGVGRRTAGQLVGVLSAKDRNEAVSPAPPHGLCLTDVRY